jgi:hypothetical protein
MAAKKLGKKIEGSEVLFSVGGTDEVIRYDSATLPQEIKDRLIPFGLGHKLGDAAASSKTPEESKLAIQKVWDGMLASNWTTRTPAEEGEAKAPKISQKTIMANLAKLPPEQQEAAKSLLLAMGFSLPEPGVAVTEEPAPVA